MEQRLSRIEDKLDALTKEIATLAVSHENRITKTETMQKGVVALCVAVLSAALTALAKALHLV